MVFNTVLTGYQEVISDPSYAGQIITFTNPHIGNYGVTATDDESRRPFCRGVIVRELSRRRSNWRSDGDLNGYLRRHGVPGIGAIDTRRLTRHIRDAGAMPGAFGTADETALKAAATSEPGTDGVDLVAEVTTAEPYTVARHGRRHPPHRGLRLRHQDDDPAPPVRARHASRSCPRRRQRRRRARPAARRRVPLQRAGRSRVGAVRGRRHRRPVGNVPVFGICLGHQLFAAALGGETVKLPFGHHGGNHPVRHLATGRVEITSQNHNFAVAPDSVPAAEVTHLNLNDGVIEGLRATEAAAFSVQHHPEAGPGPHESAYLFTEFADLMDRDR